MKLYTVSFLLLWISLLPKCRACTKTVPTPSPESTTVETTSTPLPTTTVEPETTSSTQKTTTTTVTSVCADPSSLFSTPDGKVKFVIPVANTGKPTPVGNKVPIQCISSGTDPTVVGSGVSVTYDSQETEYQDINNVDTGYEVFSMTCQSDGLWKFDISGVEADPTSSPSSGTVSNTGAVVCLGCIVAPATAYCH